MRCRSEPSRTLTSKWRSPVGPIGDGPRGGRGRKQIPRQRTAGTAHHETDAGFGFDTHADRTLRFGLVILSCAGLGSLHSYNPLPMPAAIDVVLLSLMITVVGSTRLRTQPNLASIWLIACGYLSLKYALLALGSNPAPISEFIRSYKAFIFLPVMAMFAASECFTRSGTAKTIRVILALVAIKYSLVLMVGGSRPGIWTESNFELMTLIGLFYLAYAELGRARTAWAALLALEVFVSGSRSGALELVLMLTVLYLRPRSPRFILYLCGLAVTCFATIQVFVRRAVSDSLVPIDRLQFYRNFRHESAHWSTLDWLLGTPPLTHLTSASCDQFLYYQKLIDYHDGKPLCYSVVYHMFAIRVIFDHGLLGLILLAGILYIAAKRSRVERPTFIVISGILAINALSVSSLNSEFGLLPVLVMLGLRRPGIGEDGPRKTEGADARKKTGALPPEPAT